MLELLKKTVDVIVREEMKDTTSLLHNKRVELVDHYTNEDCDENDVQTYYEEAFVYHVSDDDVVDDSMTLEVRVTKDVVVIVITHDDVYEHLFHKML
jgi:hypothetical protein